MAKIEKVTRIKNYSFCVIDRFHARKYFRDYRAALAYFLTLC